MLLDLELNSLFLAAGYTLRAGLTAKSSELLRPALTARLANCRNGEMENTTLSGKKSWTIA